MENKSQKKPAMVAAGLAVAVAVWMISGMLGADPVVEQSSALSRIENSSTVAISVRVKQMRASETVREILISGRTEPNRIVQVRAETDGVVTNINAERGDFVSTGQSILNLDMRDRNSRLSEAEALVTQRTLEFEATENLRNQQFTTDVEIAEARARLASAEANRERVLLEIRQTALSAPFDALIQDRAVEIGDFVRAGDAVLELVDINPLIIAGEVNEREISALSIGSTGKTVLESGTVLEGTVRYIAPVADPSTRTFAVELAVPNPESAIRAGLTAELSLFADTIKAHTISPALLSLADDGTIGVKTVDGNNIVQFYPVEIVNSNLSGVNVTGLPETISLITVGQGFVVAGQRVDPVLDSAIDNNTGTE